jgi:hypothetical protein
LLFVSTEAAAAVEQYVLDGSVRKRGSKQVLHGTHQRHIKGSAAELSARAKTGEASTNDNNTLPSHNSWGKGWLLQVIRRQIQGTSCEAGVCGKALCAPGTAAGGSGRSVANVGVNSMVILLISGSDHPKHAAQRAACESKLPKSLSAGTCFISSLVIVLH